MSTTLERQLLTLPQGKIEGVKCQSIYEHEYFSFEGIPYGKPPLGELRFKAPQPAEPWEGVKNCTSCANKPVQRNAMTMELEGDEDCLYLNVYVKTLQSNKPLPVLVYIYGGGFYMGEATRRLYGPDYFMEQDVILVTFNYRLCVLGFLSLKDHELQIPGNAGLKDQVLALKWVKQYISHFNGDPDNITLFGESAGGASVHYMMSTEQTRNLFHKAIPMSGCIVNPWANFSQEDFAYRLAKQYGYDGEQVDRLILEHLQTIEPHKLVDHNILTASDFRNGLLFPFGPTAEPYIGSDCVIPKSPLEMMRMAWGNSLPMLFGGTSFEGLLMYPRLKASPQSMENLKNDIRRVLPRAVREANTDEVNDTLSNRIIEAHFGQIEPSAKEVLSFLDLYTYREFWHGLHRTIMARLAYSTAPTYLYRFDFDSPHFNFYRIKFCGDDIKKGVAHADDLCYLFHTFLSYKLEEDTAELKTIRRMVGIWCAFAGTSNPNCSITEPANWLPLEQSNPNSALNISNELNVIDLPERTKLEIWNTLYDIKDLF